MTGEPDNSPQASDIGPRAAKLVENAASILQEELSAGVDAARKVQQRLFSQDSESQNASDVIERLRKEVHAAVDVAVEMVAGALDTVGASGTSNLQSVQVAEIPEVGPASAGSKVATRLMIANDNEESSEPFTLQAADLVSAEGAKIPAANVDLPEHQRVVAGQSHDTVAVTITIPPDTPPGTFTGEVQADNGAVGPHPLTVQVA